MARSSTLRESAFDAGLSVFRWSAAILLGDGLFTSTEFIAGRFHANRSKTIMILFITVVFFTGRSGNISRVMI
jgi:hypothetical protein